MSFLRGWAFDEFDSQDDLAYVEGVDYAGVTFVATVPPDITGKSLHLDTGGHARFALLEDQAGKTLIAALRCNVLASLANSVLLSFEKNTTSAADVRQAALMIDNTGKFKLFVGATEVAAGTFAANTTYFHRLDIKYLCHPSAGIFELYVNGNPTADIVFNGNTQGANVAAAGGGLDNSVQAITLGYDGSGDGIQANIYELMLANTEGLDNNTFFPKSIGHQIMHLNADGASVFGTSTGTNAYTELNAPLGAPNDSSYVATGATGKNIVAVEPLASNPAKIFAVQTHNRYVLEGSVGSATVKTGVKAFEDENQSADIAPTLNEIVNRIDVWEYKIGTTPFSAGDIDALELTMDVTAISGVTGEMYILGGYTTLASSDIDGILFSDETAINPSAGLATARKLGSGASSSAKGYVMGGDTAINAFTNDVDGINFADQAAVNPAGGLSGNASSASSFESITKGYAGGGSIGAGWVNTYKGWIFASETSANPSALLAVARGNSIGIKSSSTGYNCGGITSATEIDGMIFASETAVNPSGALTHGCTGGAGASSAINGYLMSGNNLNSVVGINFSTETAFDVTAVLDESRSFAYGSMSSIKGYVTGGNVAGTPSKTIDSLLFSSETTDHLTAELSVARVNSAAVHS